MSNVVVNSMVRGAATTNTASHLFLLHLATT